VSNSFITPQTKDLRPGISPQKKGRHSQKESKSDYSLEFFADLKKEEELDNQRSRKESMAKENRNENGAT